MTKTEIKQKAQEKLMYAMIEAFNQIEELEDEHSEKDAKIIHEEMDNQLKRVEKLFGYDQGSWARG